MTETLKNETVTVEKGEDSARKRPCGTAASRREILADGSLRFTFPNLDRQCGDCSIFNAEITISKGGPNAEFRMKATVNSSSSGDEWWLRFEFRNSQGGPVCYAPGPRPSIWWPLDIRYADRPKNYEYTHFDSKIHGVPDDFTVAQDCYLFGEC